MWTEDLADKLCETVDVPLEQVKFDCFNYNFKQDEDMYCLACEYMALTESYDRGVTSFRSPNDETVALPVTSWQRAFSNQYAANLRRNYGELWPYIHKEIINNRYLNYTAQHWIDEYIRIINTKEGKEIYDKYHKRRPGRSDEKISITIFN